MSNQTNAAAVAGMIAGHKLYKTRAGGNVSSASIPNPYYRSKTLESAVCEMAWNRGLKEGMQHAKNGVKFSDLCKYLEACK